MFNVRTTALRVQRGGYPENNLTMCPGCFNKVSHLFTPLGHSDSASSQNCPSASLDRILCTKEVEGVDAHDPGLVLSIRSPKDTDCAESSYFEGQTKEQNHNSSTRADHADHLNNIYIYNIYIYLNVVSHILSIHVMTISLGAIHAGTSRCAGRNLTQHTRPERFDSSPQRPSNQT